MKIVKVEKAFDTNTFQPIVKVCLEIPIEPIQDAFDGHGEDDFAEQFGLAFFDQLRNLKW